MLAAPIVKDFMKVALADKPAVPFRVPPGIKLIRVDPKTGMRAGPGDEKVILEAFKPGTAPPDSYSVVGYGDGDGGGWPTAAPGASACRPMPTARCAPAPAGCTEPDRSRLHRRARDVTSPSANSNRRVSGHWNEIMRAETQSLVEEIKQSVGLLRRHL